MCLQHFTFSEKVELVEKKFYLDLFSIVYRSMNVVVTYGL